MRKKNLFLRLTVLFFVCTAFLIFAENSRSETQVLEVGCLDFPPYYSTNPDTDELEGILIDFLKQLLDRAGINHKIVMYPPARLYNNLADGKTNLWLGGAGIDIFADKVIVSPEKIFDVSLNIYTAGDKPLPKSETELNGIKLITIYGYNYAGLIRYLNDPVNRITLDPSPSHESAFKKLIAGRAEYALDYKEPAEKALRTMPSVPNLKSCPLLVLENYFNISKKTPDAEGLMKKIMDTYQIIKAEGKLPF